MSEGLDFLGENEIIKRRKRTKITKKTSQVQEQRHDADKKIIKSNHCSQRIFTLVLNHKIFLSLNKNK